MSVAASAAGCGVKSPKLSAEQALTKATSIHSGEMTMTMAMNLDVPEEELSKNPQLGMVANLIKNMDITAKGTFQQEPMQSELTLDLHLKGDMQMNISLPMVVTQDKVWMKIPNIPMLPLPKDVVGKYLELDVKELSKKSGNPAFNPADTKKQQELGQDIMKVLFTNFEEKTYFSNVDKKDVKLPAGVEASRFVKFSINGGNFDPAFTTIVEKVAPQVLDLLASDKYAGLTQLKKEDIDKAKKELAAKDTEARKKDLEELKKNVKVNRFDIILGISKDDMPSFTQVSADLDVTDQGKTTKLGADIQAGYSHINEKVEFKTGIPKDVIKLDELQKKLGGGF